MKVRKLVVAAAIIVAVGAPVWAYQELTPEDYDAAMKQIRAAVGAAGDQIEARDAAGLATGGEQIVAGFTTAQAFWRGRNDERAIELATASLAAARQFQEAAAGGNVAAAERAFGELRQTCTPCHEQYRERDADGNWQIKSGF